jgi:hypothetical protein
MDSPDPWKELREAAEKATPGPWSVVVDDDGNPLSGRPSIQAAPELDCAIVHWDGFVQEYWRSARGDKEIHANARYIALANPQAILALLAERERLQRRLSEHSAYTIDLQRIIEGLCSGGPIPEPQTGARHHYDMAEAALRKSEERAGKLEAHLRECADELAEWVEHHYAATKDTATGARHYERDMEPVRRARATLTNEATDDR